LVLVLLLPLLLEVLELLVWLRRLGLFLLLVLVLVLVLGLLLVLLVLLAVARLPYLLQHQSLLENWLTLG
jgi:hypothetical protein